MKPLRLHIDKKSVKILQFGLPAVLAVLVYTIHYLISSESGNYYVIMNVGKQLLEHAMMSLTLLVGGALLFDYEIKRNGNDRR
ncbi:MAG TPA: hypothetical protein PK778_08595 [Bacillota bacterium]|nr:hypothetical protein [Bacillota bacterium]